MFTLYLFMIRDVVSDNPWTYGSTTMPLFLSFPTGFFLMLSSFFVFIIVCTVDMVHCRYPHLGRAALVCSLSFRLSSSSVTSVSHLSSKVRITPIFWCNGWCEEKCRYWSVIFRKISSFISPDSFLSSTMSQNGIVPSASSSCVNVTMFVSSILFRRSVSCCVIHVFITSSMSST